LNQSTIATEVEMKGLHHVGITVRDLDASIRFYHDVLGLQFSNEPSPWFEGEELGRGVGVTGAALRQVSLLAGDTTIELLEYRSPPTETRRPLTSNNLGASHVAFRVDDINAAKEELEAKGISFYSDVNVVDEGVLAGWRWVYFEDPDGYPLELVQVAYYNEEQRRAGVADYLASRNSSIPKAKQSLERRVGMRPSFSYRKR
jgi:catechol 2,3-dioxygenase-like lactoylglutathione lyase family enzyme